MNLKPFKRNILVTCLMCIGLFSCSDNEENVTPELTKDEVKNIVKTDEVFESIFGLAQNDAFFTKSAGKNTNTTPCYLTNVVTIEDGKKITLDFGAGCASFGKKYAGKVEIMYELIEGGYKKSFSFEGFSINNTKIIGDTNFTITLKNDAGNFLVATNANLTINLESGETITRKGSWMLEKTEGSNTLMLSDDVFSMTGSWESIGKDGFTRSITISKPLITKFNCLLIVEGVLNVKKGDKNYSVDFGDGTCDNEISFTNANGETNVISL